MKHFVFIRIMILVIALVGIIQNVIVLTVGMFSPVKALKIYMKDVQASWQTTKESICKIAEEKSDSKIYVYRREGLEETIPGASKQKEIHEKNQT